MDRHQEDTRDQRATRGIEAIIGDLRFAFRALRKRPGFALLATLTLAIGIGATAGIYTIANWVLLRPIPGVVQPGERAIVSFEDSPGQSTGFSYRMLSHVARSVDAFTTVAGTQTRQYQLGGGVVAARTIDGAIVAGDCFRGLGVQPARGRLFTPDELGPASDARVMVISDVLWRSVFGADTTILGRRVRVNATDSRG